MWSNNNFLWGPPRELVHKISGLAPLESRMCLEQQNFPKTIEDEAVATTPQQHCTLIKLQLAEHIFG